MTCLESYEVGVFSIQLAKSAQKKNICWRIKQTPITHIFNSPCNKTLPHNAEGSAPNSECIWTWCEISNLKKRHHLHCVYILKTKTSHKSRVFTMKWLRPATHTVFFFACICFFLLFFIYQLLCWIKVLWKAASKKIFVVFPALFYFFFFIFMIFHNYYFFFTPFFGKKHLQSSKN